MKRKFNLLVMLFISMAMYAQSGFQQNGSSLYYNGGKVGIGTSTPSKELMVRGRIAIAPNGIVSDEGYNGHLMITKPKASAQYINLTRSGEFCWSIGMVYNSNTFAIGNAYTDESQFLNPYFSIGRDGNVGIGTSNPQFKLDIRGRMNVEQINLDGNNSRIGRALGYYPLNYDGINFNQFSLGWVEKPDIHPEYGYNLWISSFGGMKFFTNGQPQMTLYANGNVGIGTTTPQNKLDVNGTIRAVEVIVSSGWADFVFEEDYKLPSLDEVSTHIKENKHLPGIPTAKEVEENGVSLGEINMKLLQKIEEQTLYILELHSRLQEVEKKMAEINY